MLPSFSYVRPETLSEALGRARTPAMPELHAGGTDLLGCLHDGVFARRDRSSASAALDELRGIQRAAGRRARIGALTTIAEVAASDP